METTPLEILTDPFEGRTWFETKLRARPQGVDREKGAIVGCSVCSAGPTLGHGVSLDTEFIARLVELGNAERGGLKARFGHPNMCSTALGTFLGRWRSFSMQDGKAVADVFLSNSAKKTPNGDLHSYVCELADKEPDMFGVSIVFSRGKTYKRDAKGEKVFHPYDVEDQATTEDERRKHRNRYSETPGPMYVELAELHAADVVDEPAANPNGLFSRWTNETLAGQVTQFLDTHPEVLGILADHPTIVEDFRTKYEAHMRRQHGDPPMAETVAAAPAVPAAPATVAPVQPVAMEAAAEAAVPAAPEAPPATDVAPPDVPPADDTPKVFNAAEFARIRAKFGAEAAATAVEAGGDYNTACEAAYDALLVKVKNLEEKLAAGAGGKPAGFVPKDAGTEKPGMVGLFVSKKHPK
jgi:hypothetical protein